MPPTAALFKFHLAAILLALGSASCPEIVRCPCGSTGINYTFCNVHLLSTEEACRTWSRCLQCQDEVNHCLECPVGFAGPTCTSNSTEVMHSRPKRQYRPYSTTNRKNRLERLLEPPSRPTASGGSSTCQDLENPKSGSMRCTQSRSQRSCQGRCLPGYSFQGREEEEEITLTCRRGQWRPQSKFPLCVSSGLCDLQLTGGGGGSFNCTTGMTGTRCDVICDGMAMGRFFCYPGQEWSPDLPHCIKMKGAVGNQGRTACRCQNGGSCYSEGRCVCPRGWTGSYCEQIEKAICPDPGFVPDAKRIRSDGSLASESQEFQAGESLIFSCRKRGSALEGPTLITCRDEGTWSDELPRCVRFGASCPDPGVVANANRFNIARSASTVDTSGSTYRPGQSVVYACSSGFVMHGASMLTCQQSGSWSGEKPFCSRVVPLPRSTTTTTTGEPDAVLEFCPDPGVDVNGARTVYPPLDARRRHQGFPQGSQLRFSCKEGFSLKGVDSLFCVIGGEWSSPTPTCSPQPQSAPQISDMYCGDPGPISNGHVTVTPTLENPRYPATAGDIEYPQGSRLQYSCEDSYTLRGAETLTCEKTGFWSSEMPSCVGECGRSAVQTTRRITHGKTTTAGEWPWTVAVASLYNNHSRVICGGALLDRRTVLTAAHCFDLPDTFQLFFGKYKRKTADDDDKVQSTTRLSLKIHPNYNSSTYDADIALVRFSPSIRFNKRIRPICLPTIETTAKNIVRGMNGSVTGWGLTENTLPADSLLLAKLPVLPAHHCIKAYENRGLRMPITPNMFCAGFKNGRTNVCTGDSGSPMVFYDIAQLRYTIEGVVSFGVSGDCNLPGRYTVFTKVLPYMPWVLRNMS